MTTSRRQAPISLVFALLVAALLFTTDARAENIFIGGATEFSVDEVLRPWTQESACACCVCWETAMATVLSFWDDFEFDGDGPWESIFPEGDRDDEEGFRRLSQSLWIESDVDCGAGGWSFWLFDDVLAASRAVVNGDRGYDFSFDFDEWVWWGTDLEDEIRAGKPVYYRFRDSSSTEPEGWQTTEGHAITVVGVNTDMEIIYVYGNWDEIVNQRGFDDADDHGTINVTPDGRDCEPGSHTPVTTTCGVGACAASGVLECPDGFFYDTCSPGLPAPDDSSCDGADNDCDGTVDEDFEPRVTTCGVGACASSGRLSCTGGHENDSCTPSAPARNDSLCDGVDNDCDGSTDEDFAGGPTTCGVGACAASGNVACQGGVERDSCVPGVPAVNDATCDGLDDDCDGLVDEDACATPDGGPGPDPDGGVEGEPASDDGCNCRAGSATPVADALPSLFLLLLFFVGRSTRKHKRTE